MYWKRNKQCTRSSIIQIFLKLLLSQCYDLYEQGGNATKTIKDLGACLERSPKYHCKIVGEGGEYCWEIAKILYRRTPYSKRSTRWDFLSCYEKYIWVENIWICIEWEWFLKKVWDYVAGYLIDMYENNKNENDDVAVNELKSCAVKANKIASMEKVCKIHRSVFDFDTIFCKLQVAVNVKRIEKE